MGRGLAERDEKGSGEHLGAGAGVCAPPKFRQNYCLLGGLRHTGSSKVRIEAAGSLSEPVGVLGSKYGRLFSAPFAVNGRSGFNATRGLLCVAGATDWYAVGGVDTCVLFAAP